MQISPSFLMLRQMALDAIKIKGSDDFERDFTERTNAICKVSAQLGKPRTPFTWPENADGERFHHVYARRSWVDSCKWLAESCREWAEEAGELPPGWEDWQGILPGSPLRTASEFAVWLQSAIKHLRRTGDVTFGQQQYDNTHRWLLVHRIDGCPAWNEAPDSLSGCERALVLIASKINAAIKSEVGKKSAVEDKADIVSAVLWHHHFDEDGMVRPGAEPLKLQVILDLSDPIDKSGKHKTGWNRSSVSGALRCIFKDGHDQYVCLAANDSEALRGHLKVHNLPWFPQTDGNETVSKISTKMKR